MAGVAVLSNARVAVISRPSSRSSAVDEKRSRVPLVLWVATAAFIVYGTTIPFHFVPDAGVAAQHLDTFRTSAVRMFGEGHHVSGPDFISNVWLFAPFGCFGVWALRRPRSPALRAVILTVLGCILSGGVEALQLFTTDRVSSISDIIGNTAGTAIGAVGGIALRTTAATLLNTGAASGLIQSPAFYPFLASLVLLFAGAWEPFNPTLDVGSVVSKLRTLRHDPVQFSPLSDEGVSLMQHLIFSAALFVWLKEMRVRTAATVVAIGGVIAAVALEGSQIIIESRMPGLWDAAVGAIGALVGVPLGLAYSKRPYSPIWPVALITATVVAAMMQQLNPFMLVTNPRPFQWMPFLNYYEYTTAQTVSHSAELLLTYLPLGFGLALATWGTRSRWMFPLGAAFAIAVPVEYLQRFIGGHFPDVTDIAMSVAGSWIGAWTATRGWRLFAADVRVISSHPEVASSKARRPVMPAPDLPR